MGLPSTERFIVPSSPYLFRSNHVFRTAVDHHFVHRSILTRPAASRLHAPNDTLTCSTLLMLFGCGVVFWLAGRSDHRFCVLA